jgi:hypothetical protein
MTSRLEQRVASSNDAGARAGRAASHSAEMEVHVAELRQLFDELDPSPFHDRDLDPKAAEYIVGWARELPIRASVSLLVHLDRSAGLHDEAALLGDAVRQFFGGRSTAARQRLTQLFRSGRISLLIGLTFLAAAFAASQLIGRLLVANPVGELLREGALIGGWVAMWRPIEIFLYDWWPIRAEARLYDRLAAMPVRIHYSSTEASDAWKSDWPAAFAESSHLVAALRGKEAAHASAPRAQRNA